MDKIIRLPNYLKRSIAPIDNKENQTTKKILSKYNLNTVCDNARCPNKKECYSSLCATFLIMGKYCTRNCRFCNIESHKPLPLDENEPENVALASKELGLKYVVVTSVTRDDLQDGGAAHFGRTVEAIRKINANSKVEILTPDFKGSKDSLDIIIKAHPDVFNHNMETVKNLYKTARPQAIYERSLEVLSYIKEKSPDIVTKTGIMTGLGESLDEIEQTILDIKNANVDILTIGQYIRPSKNHLEVKKYYTIEEFDNLKTLADKIGIKVCISAPLVRSSYKSLEAFNKIKTDCDLQNKAQ